MSCHVRKTRDILVSRQCLCKRRLFISGNHLKRSSWWCPLWLSSRASLTFSSLASCTDSYKENVVANSFSKESHSSLRGLHWPSSPDTMREHIHSQQQDTHMTKKKPRVLYQTMKALQAGNNEMFLLWYLVSFPLTWLTSGRIFLNILSESICFTFR